MTADHAPGRPSRRRSQRGEIVGWVVVLLLWGSVAMTVKSFADYKQAQREAAAKAAASGRSPLDVGTSKKVIVEVYRENPPPSANPDCVEKTRAAYYPSLRWNGFSWIDASDPAPPVNTAAASEWRGRISVKVGALTDLFRKEGCHLAAPGDLKTPTPQRPDMRAEWNGIWYLVDRKSDISEYNGGNCPFPATVSITLPFQHSGIRSLEFT